MSTLVIDTIQGKTTAGSINVRGEGSNNTNLQQGLAKAWISHSGYNTPTAEDSFNHASLTDVGTGNYKYNFTNNFRAAKSYTNSGGMTHDGDQLGNFAKVINPINTADILTSSVEVSATYVGSSSVGVYDYDNNYHSCLGDLA